MTNALSTELRQLSLPAGIEPATFGSEVTRAYTTPQTPQNSDTPPPFSPKRHLEPSIARKIPGGMNAHGSRVSNPALRLCHEVTVNFAIPGNTFPVDCSNRIECFGNLKSRELGDHETGFPNQHSIVIWFILSHRLPFTLSEAPHKVQRKHLRYLQSKRRSYFCQGLIFKNLIFPAFFA